MRWLPGCLLDASGSPVRTEAAAGSRGAQRRQAKSKAEAWAVRRVVLAGAPSSSGGGGASSAGGGPLEGRQAVEAEVRGHLKRQPHGPRGTLRRWIWVAGYQARRWVAPKPLRIDVRAN